MMRLKIGFKALDKGTFIFYRQFNEARLKKFHEKKEHWKYKTRILILIKG